MTETLTLLNNLDDCETTLIIKDKDGVVIINDTAGNQVMDFWVEYYTTPQNIFTVSRINGVCSENCNVIGDTVHVYINDFDWGKKDRAIVRVKVAWPDNNYSDGQKSVSYKTYSKLKIV